MSVRYTEEQKKKAVATYWRLKSADKACKKLGYPVDRHTLFKWVRERNKLETLMVRAYSKTKEPHIEPPRPRDFPGTHRYSEEDIVYAVKMYWQLGKYSATIRHIEHPKRQTLVEWVKARYKSGKLKRIEVKSKQVKTEYSEELRTQSLTRLSMKRFLF